MTNAEILLSVAGIVLSVLTYFAGVLRGKRYREEDIARQDAERQEDRQRELELERAKRIGGVVDRYRDLANRYESGNLKGMLRAGVLSLARSDEVAEACRMIDEEGLPPAIPRPYRTELQGADLLVFFQLLKQHPDQLWSDAAVRELAKQAREAGGA